MKILIIDDDKIITYAIKTIIESEKEMVVVDIGFSAEDAILFTKNTIQIYYYWIFE